MFLSTVTTKSKNNEEDRILIYLRFLIVSEFKLNHLVNILEVKYNVDIVLVGAIQRKQVFFFKNNNILTKLLDIQSSERPCNQVKSVGNNLKSVCTLEFYCV